MKRAGFKLAAVAPCGINCARCKAHLRPNNPCPGCNAAWRGRPKTRARCRMRICTEREGRFCFRCREFPCTKLKQLDQRYRAKYGMSEIANLEYIRDFGIRKFIEKEESEGISERGILCVHDKRYYAVPPESV